MQTYYYNEGWSDRGLPQYPEGYDYGNYRQGEQELLEFTIPGWVYDAYFNDPPGFNEDHETAFTIWRLYDDPPGAVRIGCSKPRTLEEWSELTLGWENLDAFRPYGPDGRYREAEGEFDSPAIAALTIESARKWAIEQIKQGRVI